MSSMQSNDFVQASKQSDTGIISEFTMFLRENKKWWLLPIIIALLGVGLLVLVAGTSAAPLIYALF